MPPKPLILIPANVIDYTGLPAHAVRDTYIKALTETTGCLPLILPALGAYFNFAEIAGQVHGVLLTGSPSNVAPAHYGVSEQKFPDTLLDPARDATTLPLIRQAIEMNKPLLAICRGFQELNVALGGTLEQKVQDLPGKLDHRDLPNTPLKQVYETLRHDVTVEKGGIFERLGLPKTFRVNSLHQQGIDRLAPGLHVEAVSEDGVIEAVSLPGKNFVLGTQWHPEGDYYLNDQSRKIIAAYGKAVHAAARK